jgi:hypothetical protein
MPGQSMTNSNVNYRPESPPPSPEEPEPSSLAPLPNQRHDEGDDGGGPPAMRISNLVT